MNVLVIYTHPNHKSLSYAFFNKVIQGSNENQKITKIEVLDLYEEQFDPVLVFNENKRRRDMHIDPKLEKYREQIRQADKIVFVYPIWWGRPPRCCSVILTKCLLLISLTEKRVASSPKGC